MPIRRFTLSQHLAIGCLATIVVALVGCSNPFDQSTPLSEWGMAMVRDDYNAAQQLLIPAQSAGWRAQTDQLYQQHGGIKSYQKGDLAPSSGTQKPIVMMRLTWDDGYTRCLRLQEDGARHIAMLDGRYQDCTTVATP